MTVRRSAYLSLASRYAGVTLHLLAIIVISRLLTPEEVGVFAVAAAFVTLTQVIRDTGVGTYLIQEKKLTGGRKRSAMGIALLIGGGLGALVFLLAEPMAEFYREDGVGEVMWVLAITFFLMPVNAVGLALLKRRFAFGLSFLAETASNIIWAGVAIGAALLGESYMSMAWASLSSVLVLYFVILVLDPSVVIIRPSLTHWRDVLGFSSMVSVIQLISYIGMLSPALILGRLATFSDVAYYNRGDSLVKTFRDTVEAGGGAVALPAFAASLRAGAFDKAGYVYATALITGVSWPVFCVLAVMAFPVIRLLFGYQWDAAVPVLQLLAIMNVFHAPVLLAVNVMFALGALKTALFKEVGIQGSRIALIILCAPYGVEAVAAGQAAVFFGALLLNQVILGRLVQFTFSDLSLACLRSAILTAITVLGPIIVMTALPHAGVAIQFILGGCAALLGWVGGVFLVNHPLAQELGIIVKKVGALTLRTSR